MVLVLALGFALAISGNTARAQSQAAAPQSKAGGPSQPAKADDALPVYIEEFFLSEAVRSEERGELQITVDAYGSHGDGSAADGESSELDLEFGVTRRLQLGMELPYGISATRTSELPVSWSSMSLNVVYQFIRSNRPFALSCGAGVGIPVSGRGETTFEPEVLLAKGFGKLQIHASVIPEWSEDEHSLAYNVAAVRPWARNWIATLEFNGRRNGFNSFYVTPGIYKHLPHRLEAGLGVPLGLGGRSSAVGVIGKVTWEFGGDDDN
jgi:hypothetical protein